MSTRDTPPDPTVPAEAALVQVVRGTPTPDEIAALLGVLLTRRRPVATAPDRPLSHWTNSGHPGRQHPFRERDGWRRTALPA